MSLKVRQKFMAGQPETHVSSIIINCVSCSSASGILLRLSEVWSLRSRHLKVYGCRKEWAPERETRASGETRVSLSLVPPILSLAHYFQAPAMQAILNNNE